MSESGNSAESVRYQAIVIRIRNSRKITVTVKQIKHKAVNLNGSIDGFPTEFVKAPVI